MNTCTNYDPNVRNYDDRRHYCGWQLYACQHGPELYCEHRHGIGRDGQGETWSGRES